MNMISRNMVHFEKPYHLLLLVLFLSLLPFILTTLPTARLEGEALLKWKNSLTPSPFLDSWLLTSLTNLCNWTGIICDSAGLITEISLSRKELRGTLANFDFTSFPNLNRLTMTDNKFTGSIPPGIEYLTKLQYLDFSSNSSKWLHPIPDQPSSKAALLRPYR